MEYDALASLSVVAPTATESAERAGVRVHASASLLPAEDTVSTPAALAPLMASSTAEMMPLPLRLMDMTALRPSEMPPGCR